MRIRYEKILLLVTDGGEPEFDYIETFMKNIVAEKYRRYLEYIDG